MALETERKFLVTGTSFRPMAQQKHQIVQGYLSRDPRATVRVRVRDDRAFITVKGLTHGCTRSEWEYEIPVSDARAMLEECSTGTIVEKTRWIVPREGLTWEVDEFHGALAPLIVAEVELPSADAPLSLPPFIGREVTDDQRYYNSALATCEKIPPCR